MLWRRTTPTHPLELLDDVVLHVGPGAFATRPALLGQDPDELPFERFEDLVVANLPRQHAAALAHLARSVSASRRHRTHRAALAELVRVLEHPLPGPPGPVVAALCVLALDRLEVSSEVDGQDAEASIAAAEELAAAALGVASLGRLWDGTPN